MSYHKQQHIGYCPSLQTTGPKTKPKKWGGAKQSKTDKKHNLQNLGDKVYRRRPWTMLVYLDLQCYNSVTYEGACLLFLLRLNCTFIQYDNPCWGFQGLLAMSQGISIKESNCKPSLTKISVVWRFNSMFILNKKNNMSVVRRVDYFDWVPLIMYLQTSWFETSRQRTII